MRINYGYDLYDCNAMDMHKLVENEQVASSEKEFSVENFF